MLLKVIFNIEKQQEDEYTEKLFAVGAQSVSTIVENKNIILEAIIAEEQAGLIKDIFAKDKYEVIKIAEQDWKDKWLENYEGILIGDDILIIPEGNESVAEKYNQKPETVIMLDPRDAFGCGSHPTTYLCLKIMKKILLKHNINTCLDIGTGTGVLAIYANKRGVQDVSAIDNSFDSIDKARYNAKINKCEDITIEQADLFDFNDFSKTYNLVAANILTSIIQKNIDKLIKLMDDKGLLLLSGISLEWADEVLELFESYKLNVIEQLEKDGWLAFLLTNN